MAAIKPKREKKPKVAEADLERYTQAKFFIGIDPGKDSGGVVKLGSKGEIIDAVVMPDMEFLAAIDLTDTMVFIEDVQPDRGWHISSAWSFAKHIGQLHLIFPQAVLVSPRTWQAGVWFHCKGDAKAKSLMAAKARWPQMTWLASKRCWVEHNGLVDAALIAEYGRMTYARKIVAGDVYP